MRKNQACGGGIQEFIEASRRKLAIAAYHLDRLRKLVADHIDLSESAPAIDVQAHFEGVVVSIMAAVDQVAQSVNSGLQLRLNSSNVVKEAFTTLAEHMPEIGEWLSEQIGRDLRRLRVRMVHYAYTKTPQGQRWTVESVETGFSGSRELVSYANSAVEYGKRLGTLLPRIEQEVTKLARIRLAVDRPSWQ
jgi:hypothetical protein